MRRIGRRARIFAMAWVVIGSTSARPDDQPKPDPEAVDRVLAEWQAKASTINSVDVRFRGTDSPKEWGSTRSEGRAILASPNLAWVEFRSVDEAGKVAGLKERLIWNGRSILQFVADEHKVFRFPIPKEWPSAPGQLRLPFFFRMTVEEAKRDYDWAVIKDDRDQIILKASSKRKHFLGLKDPVNILFLDRKTFLPKRLISVDADGTGRQTFEVVEIKVNAIEGLDALMDPCLDAWTVVEGDGWLARQFLK